ncbi:MAG: thioredoxin fold domain-containing protein [Fimbriimonadia bacterium]|jgi:thioredoxin-related protein
MTKIGTALAGLVALAAMAAAADEIQWEKSFKPALEKAKKENKALMVDFYTDWCGWCKRLDADTYPAPAVVALSKRMVNIKIDAEKGEGVDLAKKYDIHGYPTILFLDGSGKVVGRIGGYMPAEPFAAEVTRILDDFRDFPDIKKKADANPNDVASNARLAAILASRGDIKEAEKRLKVAESADAKSALLARAYNAVGDHWQSAEEYEKARGYFEKATKVAKGGYDLAYARISIAACFFSEDKMLEAKPYVQAILDQEDAPKDLKDSAKRMLEAIGP